jgi:MFS transporter, DHA3 family, tetracycline resistance protein
MINLPIIIGGLCMVGLAIILIFYMKEENFKPIDKEERLSTWKTMKGNINKIIDFSKASHLMSILFLIALFFGLYSEGFDRLWISHVFEQTQLSSFPVGNLVVVMGGIQFIVVLASFAALHYISRSSIHDQLRPIYISLYIGSLLIITSLICFAL